MSPFAEQQTGGLAASSFVARWFSLVALTKTSIRTQILIFSLAMSGIAAALGAYSTFGVRHAGDLVARTYDESLMSINYARAAAADFAAMRVASFQRLMTNDPAVRASLDRDIEKLAMTLSEDLTVAAERSQSSRAAKAVAKVRDAADSWLLLHYRVLDAASTTAVQSDAADISASDIDRYAKIVNQQIELLVNYTAGDGFLFRQLALSTIQRDLKFNVIGLTIALVLSGLFSWLLARRIIGPVAIASRAARSIADGDLNACIPERGGDELGTLLAAMGAMRDNIKEMVDREVAQRRSAQATLSDALENSREGVVLLDADGQVALINSRADEFVRGSLQLLHPDSSSGAGPATLEMIKVAAAAGISEFSGQTQLPDGRWLRVSRSATREGGAILVYSDITELKEQKAELRTMNLRLDAALAHMAQGLCLYDHEGRLQIANRRFYEIFNVSPERIPLGTTFERILHLSVAAGNHGDQTVPELLAEHERLLAHHESGSYFQHLSDGRIISIDQRATSDGGWLITYDDVTEQRRAETQIAFMARHDALTKLPNRSLLAERIEQAVAHAGQGSGFAVLCVDLDNFKQVNDTLGHPVGDELLRAVANRLIACVRDVDTVSRLGGDEFAIIQTAVESAKDAEALAERIVECIAAPYELNGHRVVVGCSVGLSLAPGDGTTGEKLLKNADVALYRAKLDGKGGWRFFAPSMDASLQERRALELDLREAMDKGQFTLFYQPFYDLRLDRICGFEALLRWNHSERGMVPPDQFIPIAEEIGLIAPLGEWVLNQACEQAANWPEEIKIAVNVSAVQFRDPGLLDVIIKALASSNLSPQRLELEITESVFLANSAETIATLHKLRARGLRIAMDDFGTGYSSLSYLRSFPFDKLKIDKSFVHDAIAGHGSKLIVRAVINLGQSLGMTTIAEGVETVEQLQQMRAEGCNEAQGFLFSPPVPATETASVVLALRNGFRKNAFRTAMAG